MTRMYFILSVAGWAWFGVVAMFLVVRLTFARKTTEPRGFDVMQTERARQTDVGQPKA